MTDIEMRAHLLTIEYLRMLATNGKIIPEILPDRYAQMYKQHYHKILSELKKST